MSIIPPRPPRGNALVHDPLLCGLTGYDGPPPCPACAAEDADRDLLARWPHLAQVAPGNHNHIAGTLAEQLARVFQPRPARPLSPRLMARVLATVTAHRDHFQEALLDLLAEPIGRLVAQLTLQTKTRNRTKENGTNGRA